ncbi:hemerythrin domain-containing protein [Rhodocista pekingensis]|uniref:Hemerythrin domain-containing protein n=1 Tax=Rhodocista pekingensis TaxID=201185 RepID=A0ABW2KSW2_9PROT
MVADFSRFGMARNVPPRPPEVGEEDSGSARLTAAEAAVLETPDLIRHILDRHHTGHRRDLAELIPLARRVEQAHAGHAACPEGLADLLAAVRDELESHMEKEEEVLFPMMLVGGSPVIAGPISCMVEEHDDFLEQLDRLEDLAGTAPPGACGTWTGLCERLGRFVAEARNHVMLENDVLFPRYAAASSASGVNFIRL